MLNPLWVNKSLKLSTMPYILRQTWLQFPHKKATWAWYFLFGFLVKLTVTNFNYNMEILWGCTKSRIHSSQSDCYLGTCQIINCFSCSLLNLTLCTPIPQDFSPCSEVVLIPKSKMAFVAVHRRQGHHGLPLQKPLYFRGINSIL